MNEWIDELSDLTAAGEPAVLVTVVISGYDYVAGWVRGARRHSR